MGLRGPQPKSAEMRVLEGERAHRPLPAARPASAFGIPERPRGMTAAARRVWDQYVEQLGQLGTLRPVDGFALQRLCEDVAFLEELQIGMRKEAQYRKREAKKEGRKSAGGALLDFTMTHEGRRAIQTINATASRIRQTELQFGLTPVSASRIEGNIVMPPGAMGSAHQEMPGIEAALCG
jgi:phage terminase small subunit